MMQLGWSRAAVSPIVAKIAAGIVGAGVLGIAIFQQPWIPVEISRAETGVLVAIDPPILATGEPPKPVRTLARAVSRSEQPIDVPIAAEAEIPPPVIRTADASSRPIPPKTTSWSLGTPTVGYQLPIPFEVPASQAGLQWNFVIPTGVQRELFLTGVELRPGNPTFARRMTLSYDATGTARKKDRQTPLPGFASDQNVEISTSLILGEWTRGMSASFLPKNTAYPVPAGADLVLTIDYAATGNPQPDPWSMGLHLKTMAPKQFLGRIEIATASISTIGSSAETLQPAQDFFRSRSGYEVPTEIQLHSIRPTGMVDGVKLKVSAVTPTRQVIPLLAIEKWNATHQNRHVFRQPISLPKGTKIQGETSGLHPDNVSLNANPVRIMFEVTTTQAEHLQPLLRHNAAAISDRNTNR